MFEMSLPRYLTYINSNLYQKDSAPVLVLEEVECQEARNNDWPLLGLYYEIPKFCEYQNPSNCFNTRDHALIRNRLLDEATSALDTASEKAVQKSLDIASEGRTTFAVAHRLSSIAHADRIYVFERGRIIEYGSHKELMVKRGRYWEYVGLQDLGN